MATVAEIFEAMPAIFNSAAAAGLNKTIQWNITGEQAGSWAFKIDNGTCELIPGGVEKPDVTFTISDKDWLALADGKLDAQSAFFSGQLKIAGDMGLALRFAQLFPTRRS
jgi:putative sterol carrier protein